MLPRELPEATSDTPHEAHGEWTPLTCLPPETVQDWIAEDGDAHPGPLPGQDISRFSIDPTIPHETLQTFARLHATLSAEDYSLACDTLCTRWEAIAQGLKAKGYVQYAAAAF
jgi:hypothetical protein